MEGFADTVASALRANECIIAFVDCAATYEGRAETMLPRGERILIIKSDNAVLLHQQTGNNPVNYMRPGSEISFDADGELILMRVKHAKEKAYLDIEIFAVHEVCARKLTDGNDLALAGNERDMSDHIREHPSCIPGFVPIAREEQTDVGFIDVFGHDGKGGLVVVECKRVTASLSAVDQLRRYVERVKEIRGSVNVRGVLAAPAITANAQKMLDSFGFEFCSVEPPKRLERWKRDQRSLQDF